MQQFEEMVFINNMQQSEDIVYGSDSDLPIIPWKNVPINTVYRINGVKGCGETVIIDLIDINGCVYRTLAPYQLSKDIRKKPTGDVLFVRSMGIKKNTPQGWYYDYNLVNIS